MVHKYELLQFEWSIDQSTVIFQIGRGVTYKKSQVHDFNGQGRQKLYLTLKRCPLGKYE